MNKHEVCIDRSKCIGCGLCVKTCVANNLEIKDKKANTLFEDCVMCGQCSAICPKKAITVTGYDSDVVEKEKEIRLNPEEVLDVIRFRRTIRQFQDKRIEPEIMTQILEAGRLTHTASNKQDVSFVVLDKEKQRFEKMAVSLFKKVKPLANLTSKMARHHTIHENFFFFKAPIVIVIMAKNKENGLLAAQNMEFVAEANGLGVLYSGYFTMAAHLSFKIKKALGLKNGKKVAMTLVLGYPKTRFLRSTPHKKLEVTYK